MDILYAVTSQSECRREFWCVNCEKVRYWAAGASTSGVEQSFSRGKKLFDHLQLLPHVNDVMQALLK